MLDKNAVGRSTPPMLNEVEKGAIRRFAESLGDYNPIYYDEDYARASGFHTIVAPPTFPVSFNTGSDLREMLGVPLRNLLAAELSIEYERPIVAGDKVLVTSRVAEVNERPSATGKIEVAVLEDEGRDEDGKLVYRLRRSLLVRGGKEG
ncbi:MAG: MaoC family dehydratase N-terminal domain-containing protein [Myxococcaceae bacterium]|jgi:acyl dehydratase